MSIAVGASPSCRVRDMVAGKCSLGLWNVPRLATNKGGRLLDCITGERVVSGNQSELVICIAYRKIRKSLKRE